MISLSRLQIGDEERDALRDVLDSGWVVQGRMVQTLEEQFAAMSGSRYGVAVSSGTAALFVALLAHGVGAGDEVITTPFSFAATANTIVSAGAKPVFADIDAETFNIDPALVEASITPRTRALLPVNLYGLPADLPALADIASRHGLALIQDACQSHAAMIDDRPLGAFGTACYSFYATKNMTTCEGGMITTDDDVVADRCRLIRNHGMRERYRHEILGFNFRMSDVHAAIGVAQLARLDESTRARIANASYLSAGLREIPGIATPTTPVGYRHVFHQYTIRVRTARDHVMQKLRQLGIETAVHYPRTIPQQPVYQELGFANDCPIASQAAEQVLSLPVRPDLSTKELDAILESVGRAL